MTVVYCLRFSESRRFKTVNLSNSLHSNDPQKNPFFHVLYWISQRWRTRASQVQYPDNERINIRSGMRRTWTYHQSSNIPRYSVENYEKFLVYIQPTDLDRFTKIIILFRIRAPRQTSFRKLKTTVHDIFKPSLKIII